jgi:hypothetical protein
VSWDVTVVIENRPGGLAEVAEVAAEAGINLDGMCSMVCEDRGIVHLLVEAGPLLAQLLESQGLDVADVQEVLVTTVADRPGALADVCRSLAQQGVNMELAYLARDDRLVLTGDKVERAKEIL